MTDYAIQTWEDGATGNTPVDAARLNHIEDGLANHTHPGNLTTADKGVANGVAALDASARITLPQLPESWNLGVSNGADDAPWLNNIFAGAPARSVWRGTPGQTYLLGAPLLLRPGGQMTLDMTGCIITYKDTTIRANLLQNGACVPTATANDVSTVAGSNVITSPQLVAAGAAVNMMVGVVGAGVMGGNIQGAAGRLWLYGNISAINGNNITLTGNFTGVAASVALVGATGYLFDTRDQDVTVIGGTWDGATNWNVLNDRYAAAYNSNFLRFRRCDGLNVVGAKFKIDQGYQATGAGWCFGVAPADCTDIHINECGVPEGACGPTVVNTSGMISRMTVRDAFGCTYDDHVAVGTVGAAFDDVEGDITDVLIDGVMANGSLRAVDLYCGQGSNGAQRYLTNARVRSIKGTTTSSPVQITNYAGNAQITASLDDITAYHPGGGVPQVHVPTGQPGISITGPVTGHVLVDAEITANVNGGVGANSLGADVVGLSVTFGAPPSGAVWIEASAYSLQQGAAAGNMIWYITDNNNNVVMQHFLGSVAAGGASVGPSARVKVTGLTPGTNYTYKVRASTSGASAGNVLAGASYPASIRVVAA